MNGNKPAKDLALLNANVCGRSSVRVFDWLEFSRMSVVVGLRRPSIGLDAFRYVGLEHLRRLRLLFIVANHPAFGRDGLATALPLRCKLRLSPCAGDTFFEHRSRHSREMMMPPNVAEKLRPPRY